MPAYAVRYPIDEETSNLLIVRNARDRFRAGIAIMDSLTQSVSTASLIPISGFNVSSLKWGRSYPIKEVLLDERSAALSVKRDIRVVAYLERSPLSGSLFCIFFPDLHWKGVRR